VRVCVCVCVCVCLRWKVNGWHWLSSQDVAEVPTRQQNLSCYKSCFHSTTFCVFRARTKFEDFNSSIRVWNWLHREVVKWKLPTVSTEWMSSKMSGQKGKDGSKKRKVKRHLHETRQMAVTAISIKFLIYFTVSVSTISPL
jgi:hypothetical protein